MAGFGAADPLEVVGGVASVVLPRRPQERHEIRQLLPREQRVVAQRHEGHGAGLDTRDLAAWDDRLTAVNGADDDGVGRGAGGA
jgi:hypothetical protein